MNRNVKALLLKSIKKMGIIILWVIFSVNLNVLLTESVLKNKNKRDQKGKEWPPTHTLRFSIELQA